MEKKKLGLNMMKNNPSDILVLTSDEVLTQIEGEEKKLIEIVKNAYIEHSKGESSLPFSSFLRFPNNTKNRIIALPAYIKNSTQEIAGIKWVASFPNNIKQGIDRASASLILNDTSTGRPYCFMEASHINAHRTAASAALASQLLSRVNNTSIALIGCGPINYHILRYVMLVNPSITTIYIYDRELSRAKKFSAICEGDFGFKPIVCSSFTDAASNTKLISLATNAGEPWIDGSYTFSPDSLILHISLRDIKPKTILSSYNVVDDGHHVNREKTSIELSYQQRAGEGPLMNEIGKLLTDPHFAANNVKQPIIYSPFGLGVLDISVGKYLYEKAIKNGSGTLIKNFHKESNA